MNVELVISQPWIIGILLFLLIWALGYAGYIQTKLYSAHSLFRHMGFDPYGGTWDLERFEKFGRSLRALSLRKGRSSNLKTPPGEP